MRGFLRTRFLRLTSFETVPVWMSVGPTSLSLNFLQPLVVAKTLHHTSQSYKYGVNLVVMFGALLLLT